MTYTMAYPNVLSILGIFMSLSPTVSMLMMFTLLLLKIYIQMLK